MSTSARCALGSAHLPVLMGIVNVTPDSFADGGRFLDPIRARDHAASMVEQGAAMLDVGGESTRPGAARVPEDEQLARLLPVIRAVRATPGPLGVTLISVDTTRARVAQHALDAGADAINDVSAGTDDPDMLPLAARAGCGIILMHRVAPPDRDQYSDRYAGGQGPMGPDVVSAVVDAFRARMQAAMDAGISPEAIVLDPGLGFGKTVPQNLELIRATPELLRVGRPVLSALSRKSFVGRVSLGRDSQPDERLAGTLALSVEHLRLGARLFRVHDVGACAQALRAAWAVGGFSAAAARPDTPSAPARHCPPGGG